MKGKKFKEEERKPILLSEKEIIKLKIQALNKGIDPTWVSILCRRKRKIEKIEDVEKKRWAKILLK